MESVADELSFVVGPVLGLARFPSAVLALSLFEGAYASEIFRAGIVSIHRGQWEAGFSLGLSTFHTYRTIILPQAMRIAIPPIGNQYLNLIKNSSLGAAIGFHQSGDLEKAEATYEQILVVQPDHPDVLVQK